MEKNKRNIGPALIILAGCFWPKTAPGSGLHGGIVVFSESPTLLSGLGIILILAAVILLNRKPNS